MTALGKLNDKAVAEHAKIEKAISDFNAFIQRARETGWIVRIHADGDPHEAIISNEIELDLTVYAKEEESV